MEAEREILGSPTYMNLACFGGRAYATARYTEVFFCIPFTFIPKVSRLVTLPADRFCFLIWTLASFVAWFEACPAAGIRVFFREESWSVTRHLSVACLECLEQDEKSLNETILQAKNHEMEIDQVQGGGAPPVPTEGVFTPQMIAVLTETIRREVGIAVAQEIAKLSRGEASADAVGASAGLGLRSSPSRDSGLTPKIRKPPRKMPRKMVTVEDRDIEEV
ncbi:unnamed protein product [Trichogramma brassicae]|uniref:Uncharacterized protein n=1 Tax=Trichogramma brassicae TaxID=86971 RepID=A0A6H5J8V3_9HYME|nr:unnamed protein product [Trichogramma brassicae]